MGNGPPASWASLLGVLRARVFLAPLSVAVSAAEGVRVCRYAAVGSSGADRHR